MRKINQIGHFVRKPKRHTLPNANEMNSFYLNHSIPTHATIIFSFLSLFCGVFSIFIQANKYCMPLIFQWLLHLASLLCTIFPYVSDDNLFHAVQTILQQRLNDSYR